MFHSSFDLEAHGRHMREEAERQAMAARIADAAWRSRSRAQAGRQSDLWRVMSRIQGWLMRNGTAPLAPAQTEPAIIEVVPAAFPAAAARPRPIPARAADPYAGLLVLARAPSRQPAEAPCGVNDC